MYSAANYNFWFVEVSDDYEMVDRLKEVYETYIIASSIFFEVYTQAPVFNTIYHENNL